MRRWLPLLCGSDLATHGRARRAYRHLADCVSCRRQFAAWRVQRQQLAAAGADRAGRLGLDAGFFARLRGDALAAVAAAPKAGEASRSAWPAMAWSAAALAAAGLVLALLGTFGDRPAARPSPLLTRSPLQAQPAAMRSELLPLAYQGLEAQRQVLLLFESGEPLPRRLAAERAPWPAPSERAAAGTRPAVDR